MGKLQCENVKDHVLFHREWHHSALSIFGLDYLAKEKMQSCSKRLVFSRCRVEMFCGSVCIKGIQSRAGMGKLKNPYLQCLEKPSLAGLSPRSCLVTTELFLGSVSPPGWCRVTFTAPFFASCWPAVLLTSCCAF